MTHFPDYLDPTEARIINRLITAAFREGLEIRVVDEEGDVTAEMTQDRAAIQRGVAATELTLLDLMAGEDTRIATVFLIHGNGEDVISDVACRPFAEGLIDGILDYANNS